MVLKNVVDHDQAFLIYSMFQEQRKRSGKNVYSPYNDIMIFMEQFPAVKSLEVIFLLALLMFMALRNWIKTDKEDRSLLGESFMFIINWKLCRLMDTINFFWSVLGVLYFTYMFQSAIIDLLRQNQFNHIDLYRFRVLRTEHDRKAQGKRHLLFFFCFSIVITYLTYPMHPETTSITSMIWGYFGYRCWAYLIYKKY